MDNTTMAAHTDRLDQLSAMTDAGSKRALRAALAEAVQIAWDFQDHINGRSQPTPELLASARVALDDVG